MTKQANVQIEVRFRRRWLVHLSIWCWNSFGWLFPDADTDAVISGIVRMSKPEMRIGGRGRWKAIPDGH